MAIDLIFDSENPQRDDFQIPSSFIAFRTNPDSFAKTPGCHIEMLQGFLGLLLLEGLRPLGFDPTQIVKSPKTHFAIYTGPTASTIEQVFCFVEIRHAHNGKVVGLARIQDQLNTLLITSALFGLALF